ncbi:hypothetical protein RJ639_027688 [Escallonia herrerae]|uniref:Cell wall protein n=1 Tax=Escallonia herrerae TaxID=1293975 RepID=A0AA88X6K1_9ASTE|nr:hypothetical protein RJ639_025828 [Escallonia herrerae]KAK3039544.1 hypothetical protein RJ639_027688 [Escallonia herrerae]
MAYNPTSILLSFLFILSLAWHALSARDVPTDSKNVDDSKQPESFISFDGSVLIPGVGRVMAPHVTEGFNPYTYNPITGTDGGTGTVGGLGSGTGGGGGGYIPGGDDTFVPNPGYEVPSGGGSVPVTGP